MPTEPPDRFTGVTVGVTLCPPTTTEAEPEVTDGGTATGDVGTAAEGAAGAGVGVAGVDDPPPPPPPPPLAVGVTELDAAEALEVPMPFVAVLVNVYAVPAVNPVTVHEVAGTVTTHDPPAGTDVTVYDDTVPPEDGAAMVTVAD